MRRSNMDYDTPCLNILQHCFWAFYEYWFVGGHTKTNDLHKKLIGCYCHLAYRCQGVSSVQLP